MAAIIHIENLTLRFNGQSVLKTINLDFESGRIYGIVGNNGSGKTVLLKCICGFLRPSEGQVSINEKLIGKDVDFPPKTGVIIESPGFIPELSAYGNLKILASLSGKADKEQIYNVIRKVGLDPESKKHVGKYSLGMRQRLGIAQAIMDNPELLILDEPFNGLDKKGTVEMRGLLKEMKLKGCTILLTSHNQADIDELCDEVIELDDGAILS